VLGSAVPGHILVIPKKHAKKFSELGKGETSHIMKISTVLSTIVFEVLQLHGTNIIANTSKPHLFVEVVPRKMDDSLDLLWERNPIPEEQLSEIQKKIKDKTDLIGVKKPEAKVEEKPKEEISEKEGMINYLLKQLQRLP
jgi:diadenosine tetraphosphate (Ap4A) HIT family hydrolase